MLSIPCSLLLVLALSSLQIFLFQPKSGKALASLVTPTLIPLVFSIKTSLTPLVCGWVK